MKNEVKEPYTDYNKIYTYADYLSWNIQERLEILKGRIFKLSAPARRHQEVSWSLSHIFSNYLRLKDCKAYAAPFDVRLIDKQKKSKQDKDIVSVVQPDLCIICDKEKLDKRGCIGAPDLVVEILSPSNSSKEMKHKYSLYEENEVREYWVIDYVHEMMLVYVLENGKYRGLPPLTREDLARSVIFPDLSFNLEDIFKE